jgi:hypothetical protein
MRTDDEFGRVSDISGEGLDFSRDYITFLREGYMVRSHDVATADQECSSATPGLRVNEHANRPEDRETAVALFAVILDEGVGYCRFSDKPKGDARSGGALRASHHKPAAAIFSSTL